jgi:hypothetical protein
MPKLAVGDPGKASSQRVVHAVLAREILLRVVGRALGQALVMGVGETMIGSS